MFLHVIIFGLKEFFAVMNISLHMCNFGKEHDLFISKKSPLPLQESGLLCKALLLSVIRFVNRKARNSLCSTLSCVNISATKAMLQFFVLGHFRRRVFCMLVLWLLLVE